MPRPDVSVCKPCQHQPLTVVLVVVVVVAVVVLAGVVVVAAAVVAVTVAVVVVGVVVVNMAASYFLTPLFLINCSPTPKTLNPPRKADLRRGMKLFEPYQDFAKRYEHCAKPSARRGWKKPA